MEDFNQPQHTQGNHPLDIYWSSKSHPGIGRWLFLFGSIVAGFLMLLLPLVLIWEFLRGLSWDLLQTLSPVVFSTLFTAFLGLVFALPLAFSLSYGLLLNPYSRLSRITMRLLSISSALPTVVLGYGAFTILTPLLQGMFGRSYIDSFNTLAVSIAISFLLTPLLTKRFLLISETFDPPALAAVTSIGSSWSHTILNLMVPTSFRQICAALGLAYSRAIGQTMISALAGGIGNFSRLGSSSETLGSFLVRLGSRMLILESKDYSLLFGAGFILFFLALGFYLLSNLLDPKDWEKST